MTGATPSVLPGGNATWTGGFQGVGDLIGIPQGTAAEIQDIIDNQPGVPLPSLVVSKPLILEAVAMPSPFAPATPPDTTRIPGRVNVNTCSDEVWEKVSGLVPADRPPLPVETTFELLQETAFTSLIPDVRDFQRDVANRLTEAATIRSNVFAVWITLKVTDSGLNDAPPVCYRLFAIVDRSIVAEYIEGENKNARETIRLKRFLD